LHYDQYDHAIVYRSKEEHLDADAMSQQAWPQSLDGMVDLDIIAHGATLAHVSGG